MRSTLIVGLLLLGLSFVITAEDLKESNEVMNKEQVEAQELKNCVATENQDDISECFAYYCEEELEKPSEHSFGKNGMRMLRGVTNLVTCWVEVPRCMLYDNSEVPLWGLIAGVFEGAGCTAMRAFSGAVDIVSFGFDRNKVYDDKFREYVWESRWLPTEKKE